MNYYRLNSDVYFPGRWYLSDIGGSGIKQVYNWQFSAIGGAVDGEYEQSVSDDGKEMDFTLTNSFIVPIVSDRMKDILSFVEGVRFMRVAIAKDTLRQYYIMVVDEFVDCFDESQSIFKVFTPGNPIRPDRVGDYHSVIKLMVDPARAEGHDIFRIKKYPIVVIVSERVKQALEAQELTGLCFQPCS